MTLSSACAAFGGKITLKQGYLNFVLLAVQACARRAQPKYVLLMSPPTRTATQTCEDLAINSRSRGLMSLELLKKYDAPLHYQINC